MRIYCDSDVLTALCGKPAPDKAEAAALSTLRVALSSGDVDLVAGWGLLRELRGYRRGRARPCMRRIIASASVFVERDEETEALRLAALAGGASKEDCRHVAAARAAGATLLTYDKQLRQLSKQGRLGVSVKTPAEYFKGQEGKADA